MCDWIFWFLMAVIFTGKDICYFQLFGHDLSKQIVIMVFIIFCAIFAVIGWRLLYIAKEDQENTNSMFSSFAEQYREQILELYNVTNENE